MTDDDKALAKRLRRIGSPTLNHSSLLDAITAHKIADRIEALSAENERLREALMLCAKHVDWMPHPHCVEVETAIRAALGETE